MKRTVVRRSFFRAFLISPEKIEDFFGQKYNSLMAQDFLIKAVVTLIIFIFFIILNEIVFRRFHKEREKTHLLFLQRFIRFTLFVVLGMMLVSEYSGLTRLVEILAGSIAIISGIIAFAAQSVLRDFFAGLMISIYRPFDVGDRLLLNAVEKPCVVEELTMRHTVLKTMDGIRYIIPNSEIGSMTITNTSYRQRLRGSFIQVSITYNENVGKAVQAVREAVRECPYTFPNNQDNADLNGYGDVYLMGFMGSSLLLETVIWTEPETDNFLACSEVRIAIIHKFRKYGIELPYEYINVIEKDEVIHAGRNGQEVPELKPKKRNTKIKTDPVEIRHTEKDLEKVFEKAEKYALHHEFDAKKTNTLRLLSEELIGFSREITGDAVGKFWIEGNRNKVHVCLRVKTELDADARREYLDLSTSGENAAVSTFMDSIRDLIETHALDGTKATLSYSRYKEQSGAADDDLEKKIIMSMADDIKVGIRGSEVEITVLKIFR